jgi:hypothetical protein
MSSAIALSTFLRSILLDGAGEEWDDNGSWGAAKNLTLEEPTRKKFMVLFMASSADFEKAMKNSTPEQQKKGMDAWMKWMDKNKKSIVEGGAPLGKTKRVDAKGTSNTANGVGGYSIVQAQSHDAAAKLFGKSHPHLQMMPGGWIEIVEIMPMPDM